MPPEVSPLSDAGDALHRERQVVVAAAFSVARAGDRILPRVMRSTLPSYFPAASTAIDCPSRIGNGICPKSSTMCRTSLSITVVRSADNCRRTLAVIGALCVYKLTYGRAADHGGIVDPRTVSTSMPSASPAVRCPSASGNRRSDRDHDTRARFGGLPAASRWSLEPGARPTSAARRSCTHGSSARCASCRSSPVGHGEMHAMQKLQMSALTT